MTAKAKGLNLLDDAKILGSGALAGAVSRTATAPLERLKIFNQVERHARRAAVSERWLSNAAHNAR